MGHEEWESLPSPSGLTTNSLNDAIRLLQFNDTTNNTGLIQDCEDLTGLGDTNISGNTAMLKRFTRMINAWYLKAVAWILESSGVWNWDDSHYTDFPIGTANLVDNQPDYTLPIAQSSDNDASTLLKITRVEVLQNDGTTWGKLEEIDEFRIKTALTEFQKTKGQPVYYREIANSIFLYPSPDSTQVTTTNGLKVYFQRTPILFTNSDTTKEPGIPRLFHRILSLGASYDYGVGQGSGNLGIMRSEISDLKQQLFEFFGRRNREVKTRILPRRERYN